MSARWFWCVAALVVMGGGYLVLAAEDTKPAAKVAGEAPVAVPKTDTAPGAKKPVATDADPFGEVSKQRPAERREVVVNVATGDVGEEKILAALERPANLEFVDTPLTDVMAFLADQFKIPIFIDQRAIAENNVPADSPVTMNIKGIKLRSALGLMLGQLNLDWAIRNEVLLVTSPEAAAKSLVIRTYDVADLVAVRDEKDQPWDDFDSLIEMIRSIVGSGTWADVGGSASISPLAFGSAKVIVVSQTYREQMAIAELLAELRKLAKIHGDGKPPMRANPHVPILDHPMCFGDLSPTKPAASKEGGKGDGHF